MRKLLSFLVVMIAALLFVSSASASAKEHSSPGKSVSMEINKVKAATAKYHDVNQALKDGYVKASPYVPQMGYHYVKGSLVDGVVDPLAPEALLYIPTKTGLKLVGVEYLSTENQSLFGVNFDPPHDGLPYTLHAWIWTANPDGMFNAFNPEVPIEEPATGFNDPKKVDWAINKVRMSTIKYHDVNQALKDGYVKASPYVPQMGYHYVKESLVDGLVDPLTPEALLYIPTKTGLKLVGVEYMSTEKQSLFGINFDPPHNGLPYTLHAWIWTPNPDGMFDAFNPRIPDTE